MYVETSAHTNAGMSALVDAVLDVIARDIVAAGPHDIQRARIFQIGLATVSWAAVITEHHRHQDYEKERKREENYITHVSALVNAVHSVHWFSLSFFSSFIGFLIIIFWQHALSSSLSSSAAAAGGGDVDDGDVEALAAAVAEATGSLPISARTANNELSKDNDMEVVG